VRQLDDRVLLGGQGDGLLQRDAPRLGARNAGKRKQQQQRGNGLCRSCRRVLAVYHHEQNRMATNVKNIDPSSPKAITLASGDQRLEPETIMGMTPTAAAAEVRKMGRNRRSPASRAACSSSTPAFIRS